MTPRFNAFKASPDLTKALVGLHTTLVAKDA